VAPAHSLGGFINKLGKGENQLVHPPPPLPGYCDVMHLFCHVHLAMMN
jgi:hypothetical protein